MCVVCVCVVCVCVVCVRDMSLYVCDMCDINVKSTLINLVMFLSTKGVLQKQAGVCIFDSAPPERFGGGRLQDYIINSNTFGGKFVTNIVQDKPNVIPPEKASGTILESLEKTVIAQALGKYGTDVAPLNDIGMFLVEIGRQVKKLIDHYHESSKYESRTEVTQLQQSECKQFWKITSLNIKTQMMSITYAFQVYFLFFLSVSFKSNRSCVCTGCFGYGRLPKTTSTESIIEEFQTNEFG
jgi:hypothetical protein